MAMSMAIGATVYSDSQVVYRSPRNVVGSLGVTLSELAGPPGVARDTLAARTALRTADATLSPVVRILAMSFHELQTDQDICLQLRLAKKSQT